LASGTTGMVSRPFSSSSRSRRRLRQLGFQLSLHLATFTWW
jgi:hypothetical protein